MILCGATAVGKGERQGARAGSPPLADIDWRAERAEWFKKRNSYVSISNVA